MKNGELRSPFFFLMEASIPRRHEAVSNRSSVR